MNAPSIASARLISANVLAEVTTPDGASEPLATAHVVLRQSWTSDVGLWEAGPGTDVDVESDELFLVLSGAGTVTFADGSRIDLRPGVLVQLRSGDRTTWEITDRMRKLYLSGGERR
ncbi:cupin domain-containing protein [Nonomuraea sp. NPDC050783]|uniref:cupin domain-containing protein n=1 Tax=Nonomuraea sp. NPDC050783 TaxID=3154634 RepID=UPI003466BEDB